MRKIEGVNWMEAYQAYCLSGLGLRGFITQEMYKFCSDEKIPSRGSVIRYFSEIKRQLENANTSADAETVRVCNLDDQQLQDVIQGQQSSDQEYLVKVFANGMSIAVEVKDPHVFIAKLIKQVRR